MVYCAPFRAICEVKVANDGYSYSSLLNLSVTIRHALGDISTLPVRDDM